ncbi:unnamed protein product, partial [marine sediment metagenome]
TANIDNCILEEIKFLWSKGIQTIESCCGHNKQQGYICVIPEAIKKMEKLGYKHYINPNQLDAKDFFIPKSILKSKKQVVIAEGVIIKLDGNYYVGKRINNKTCIIYSRNLHRFFKESEKMLNAEIIEKYIDKEIELIIREK